MTFYIVAGEVSGDVHAANLMKALRGADHSVRFRGVGGDHMIFQGLDCFLHIRRMNFMGLAEVLRNLFSIRNMLRDVKKDIVKCKPDAIILVDYPGFNLQLSHYAKKHSIPCIYYISPKLWAWRSSRANIIRRNVDLMLCILPFEQDFYKHFGYKALYVGNPVPDAIEQHVYDEAVTGSLQKDTRPVVALLPGSRKQEITQCLPVMLDVVARFPQYRFVIAALDHTLSSINDMNHSGVEVLCNKTYELLSCSSAALVTSGTATLETALFNVPQVCCYKTSALTYHVAKRVIRVPYISLVNLIANSPVIKELIQDDFEVSLLSEELQQLTERGPYRETMLKAYGELKQGLGGAGASVRAADHILAFMTDRRIK
ncbi:MAG: lipid-A-disaccharide synthase [Bacteroidota bacterium]|jgi:lipid-A-disaccharide synthase